MQHEEREVGKCDRDRDKADKIERQNGGVIEK
jgi:hypothetical protein